MRNAVYIDVRSPFPIASLHFVVNFLPRHSILSEP